MRHGFGKYTIYLACTFDFYRRKSKWILCISLLLWKYHIKWWNIDNGRKHKLLLLCCSVTSLILLFYQRLFCHYMYRPDSHLYMCMLNSICCVLKYKLFLRLPLSTLITSEVMWFLLVAKISVCEWMNVCVWVCVSNVLFFFVYTYRMNEYSVFTHTTG